MTTFRWKPHCVILFPLTAGVFNNVTLLFLSWVYTTHCLDMLKSHIRLHFHDKRVQFTILDDSFRAEIKQRFCSFHQRNAVIKLKMVQKQIWLMIYLWKELRWRQCSKFMLLSSIVFQVGNKNSLKFWQNVKESFVDSVHSGPQCRCACMCLHMHVNVQKIRAIYAFARLK